MVVIRLARFGKKNHPTFRVIVSDKQKDTKGTYLEQVGSYNPHTDPAEIVFKDERIQHWLSVGAQPSNTVHNLLIEKGLLQGDKRVTGKPKAKPASDEAKGEPAAKADTKPAESETKSEEPKAEAEPAKQGEKPEEKPAEEAK